MVNGVSSNLRSITDRWLRGWSPRINTTHTARKRNINIFQAVEQKEALQPHNALELKKLELYFTVYTLFLKTPTPPA
jgi:hypothetical protein